MKKYTPPIRVNFPKKPVEVVSKPLFEIGELVPFKGVWFAVKSISAKELVLEPRAFTKDMKDRMKAGRVVQEASHAATEGEKPSGDLGKHSGVDALGPAAETSDRDCDAESR